MSVPTSLKLVPISAALLALTACGSSSSGSSSGSLSSQAVDGYIVGADVTCDDVESGLTAAAGRFTCPSGTQLSQISGGFDVGTDENATTGDVAFVGVLTGLASQPYVTPLSTLAIAIALADPSSDGTVDLNSYREAQTTLAQALGVDLEVLNANPVSDLDAAKTNAQVHQTLIAFAPNVESYQEISNTLAAVIVTAAQSGGQISLTADAATTLEQINEALAASGSTLALSTANLNQAVTAVITANNSIDNAESIERVVAEAETATLQRAPVTIVRDDASVILTTDTTGPEVITLSDFENPELTAGQYTAQLFSDLTSVSYETDVFQFNQDIDNATITVAFELKSVNTGDPRTISFSSDDVVISASRNVSDSLSISMASEDSTFAVVGVDSEGVTTEAVAETGGQTLAIDGSDFTINLTEINNRLSDLGFEDILASSGNFSATLVISGLSIIEEDDGVIRPADTFTLGEGDTATTGNGFRGYVSITR